MSGSPIRSFRETLIRNLKIHRDEPDPNSNYFGSKIFAEKLANFILDSNLPTPYVIGLDGEWGSGKTTLLKKTFNLINEQRSSNYTTVWFDAWKYEKYDPVLALYQHILQELEKSKGALKSKLKEILLNTALLASDLLARESLGVTLDDIRERYATGIEEIKTIHEKLEENIGQDGRLIVFIDDLDRCENENILAILSNVKEVLNSKKTVFILGIDMKKIAISWDIKHRGYEIAKIEGKEHVDKLFQLKLRIPPKSQEELMRYVNSLIRGLPDKEKQLISKSVKENPRKIKLILNTMYFLAKQMRMARTTPDDLPFLLTITLFSVIHNDLFQIVKQFPAAFFDAMFVCLLCLDHKELRDNMASINRIMPDNSSTDLHGGRINRSNISKAGLEILNIVEKDERDFLFLLDMAEYLDIPKTKNRKDIDQEKIDRFSQLIRETPFLS